MAITQTTKRILYIDDSQVSRRAISLLFSKEGHDVDSAENGFQAMSFIEKKKYDLVITDYEMPLMNGLELLLVIRHSFSKEQLPVITLTANQDKELIEDFIKFGTNAYMIKSNDLNPLHKKANELMGKASK